MPSVGLDPAAYAGHSLRSGFLTSAAESGTSIWKMTEVSRHRSIDVLRGYVRRAISFVSTRERRSSERQNARGAYR